MSVVLIDDHLALRQGLEVLLERRGVRVLASVGSASTGLACVRDHKPEVAIIDLQLPDQSGIHLVRQIGTEHLDVKILIYTGSQERQTLVDAIETGAQGVVLKPAGLGSLVDALREVARGNRHIDPAIAQFFKTSDYVGHLLSRREREVFELLAEGLSGEEIATRLAISAETVRTHVRNATRKLGAKTRTEAVVRALASGEIQTARFPK